ETLMTMFQWVPFGLNMLLYHNLSKHYISTGILQFFNIQFENIFHSTPMEVISTLGKMDNIPSPLHEGGMYGSSLKDIIWANQKDGKGILDLLFFLEMKGY